MNEQEKIDALADVFEVGAGEISKDTLLDTLEWDSMAMLSVMAVAKARGKGMTGAQVREAKTIGDLIAYL